MSKEYTRFSFVAAIIKGGRPNNFDYPHVRCAPDMKYIVYYILPPPLYNICWVK